MSKLLSGRRRQLETGVERRNLPRKIILVRHAQSQGNVDSATYSVVPDSEVPLVRLRWKLKTPTIEDALRGDGVACPVCGWAPHIRRRFLTATLLHGARGAPADLPGGPRRRLNWARSRPWRPARRYGG